MARRSEIATCRNLGPASEHMLNGIGVYTLDELRQMGSVQAYKLLRSLGHRVSLNLVYAIEGAILGMHWAQLPRELKAELRRQVKR